MMLISCRFSAYQPTRTISSPGPLFLWNSAFSPLPCHLCLLPCSSTIICPCSSISIYSGGGPLGSTSSMSKRPRWVRTGTNTAAAAPTQPCWIGSLLSPPLSRSLAAAAARAQPSLWLRPSQSLEEQKQVLACRAAIRAALAASCWAKREALSFLRSRRAVKNF